MQTVGVSLISAMIPCINLLICSIDNFKDDTSKHLAICSAAIHGLLILNKYYQKSDESFMYWIAMVLDP